MAAGAEAVEMTCLSIAHLWKIDRAMVADGQGRPAAPP
jgi:hypothetical protein